MQRWIAGSPTMRPSAARDQRLAETVERGLRQHHQHLHDPPLDRRSSRALPPAAARGAPARAPNRKSPVSTRSTAGVLLWRVVPLIGRGRRSCGRDSSGARGTVATAARRKHWPALPRPPTGEVPPGSRHSGSFGNIRSGFCGRRVPPPLGASRRESGVAPRADPGGVEGGAGSLGPAPGAASGSHPFQEEVMILLVRPLRPVVTRAAAGAAQGRTGSPRSSWIRGSRRQAGILAATSTRPQLWPGAGGRRRLDDLCVGRRYERRCAAPTGGGPRCAQLGQRDRGDIRCVGDGEAWVVATAGGVQTVLPVLVGKARRQPHDHDALRPPVATGVGAQVSSSVRASVPTKAR
jgi:hypothetical protein